MPRTPKTPKKAAVSADAYQPQSLHRATAERLIGVVRVSRVMDREGESFMSPDEQREAMEWWCQSHHSDLVDVVVELDKSGKTTDREGLADAMARVMAGHADGIIVARVDRYARSMEEGLRAVRHLDEAGKAFVAVKDGIEPGMSKSSTGWLLLGFLFMFAEWQWRQYAENWSTAKRRHIKAGIANAEPYGYRKRDDRRLEPDPDTAEWVPYIFGRRAAGLSWMALAEELNDVGAPTPGRLLRLEKGAPAQRVRKDQWLFSTVRSLVHNRTYLGELRIGDDINPTGAPPLVTQEEWDAAHATMKTPGRRGKAYLLSGLTRCATCGGRMSGWRAATGPVQYRYYRCRGRYSWGQCPDPAMVNAEALEAYMVDELERRFFGVTMDGVDADESGALADALARLDAAKADRKRFMTSPGIGALTEDEYNDIVEDHNVKVAGAQGVVDDEKVKAVGFALPADLLIEWDDLDHEDRRAWMSAAFALIAVRPGKRQRPAVEDVTRVWARGESGMPEDLPDRRTGSRFVPIVW